MIRFMPAAYVTPSQAWHADGDLLIVRELRKMSTLSKQGAKIAAPVSDEQLKWLNWPDFVQVCSAI